MTRTQMEWENKADSANFFNLTISPGSLKNIRNSLIVLAIFSLAVLLVLLLFQNSTSNLVVIVKKPPAYNLDLMSMSSDKKALAQFAGYLEYVTKTRDTFQIDYQDLNLISLGYSQNKLHLDFDHASALFDIHFVSGHFKRTEVERITLHLNRPHLGLASCSIENSGIMYEPEHHYKCTKGRRYPCFGLTKSGSQMVTTLVVEALEFQVNTQASNGTFGSLKTICSNYS